MVEEWSQTVRSARGRGRFVRSDWRDFVRLDGELVRVALLLVFFGSGMMHEAVINGLLYLLTATGCAIDRPEGDSPNQPGCIAPIFSVEFSGRLTCSIWMGLVRLIVPNLNVTKLCFCQAPKRDRFGLLFGHFFLSSPGRD